MNQRRVWLPRLGLAAVAVAAVLAAVMLSAITGAQYGPGPPEHPGIPEPPGIPDRPGSPTEPLTITVSAPDVCEVHRPLQGMHTVIHAPDASGNRPAPTVTRYWPWNAGGTMEVSWEVSGGEPPYYVLVDGQPVDGASGTVELSCAISHGTYQSHPTYGRTLAEAPVVDSGVLEIVAEVSDQSQTGGRAKDTAKTYALLTADHDHILRSGQTYRIAGRLMTIPEGMTMQMGHWDSSGGVWLYVVDTTTGTEADQQPWIALLIDRSYSTKEIGGQLWAGPPEEDPDPWWRFYELGRWTGDGGPFNSAAALDAKFDQLLASRNGATAVAQALGQDRVAGLDVGTAGHDSGAPGSDTGFVIMAPTNGNLILGRTTLICTTEPEFFGLLDEAITAWNTRLHGLLVDRDDHPIDPLTLHKVNDEIPASCASADIPYPQRNAYVVALRATDAVKCTNSEPAACHTRRTDANGRRDFLTGFAGHTDHALIIFEHDAIQPETVLHELGHTLGLPDYRSCDALYGKEDDATDVDRNDDDLALMRNNRAALCRSVGLVTGRDLRDLFEVYYPAPPIGVTASFDPHASGYGTVRFRWDQTTDPDDAWTGTDLTQLSHQANDVGLFGRKTVGSGAWTLLARTGTGSASKHGIDWQIVNDHRYAEYMLVGLTQVQLDILARGTAPTSWTYGAGVHKRWYTQGEPALVSQVMTAQGDAEEVALRLTASVAPASCYVAGDDATQELTVRWWTSGDDEDVTLTLGGQALTRADGVTGRHTLECADLDGDVATTELVVTATEGQATASVMLDVYDRELDEDAAPVLELTDVPETCEYGQMIEDVVWTLTPQDTVGKYDVWIDGVEVTASPVNISCPHPDVGRVRGFAVRADGSGSFDHERQDRGITLPVLDADAVRATPRSASSVELSWASLTKVELLSSFWLCVSEAAKTTDCDKPDLDDEQWVRILTEPTEHTVSGLKPNTTYTFHLIPRYGKSASDTLTVSATTPQGTQPPAEEPGDAPNNEDPGGDPGENPNDDNPGGLSLTDVQATPGACDTGGQVALSWSVSGGVAPYTVKVDGVEVEANPYALTCQAEAGSQTVQVEVEDKATPPATASALVTLTVLVPEITVSGRLYARRTMVLIEGEVVEAIEFAFKPEDGDRICPAERFVPIESWTLNQYKQSSAVLMEIDGEDVNIGKIRAQRLEYSNGTDYIDVCFRWSDGEDDCPANNNFEFETANMDSWHYSDTFDHTFRPGTSVSSLSEDELMDTGTANEPSSSNNPEQQMSADP